MQEALNMVVCPYETPVTTYKKTNRWVTWSRYGLITFVPTSAHTQRWQRDSSLSTQYMCPKIYSSATARQFGVTVCSEFHSVGKSTEGPLNPYLATQNYVVSVGTWNAKMSCKRFLCKAETERRSSSEHFCSCLITEKWITLLSPFFKC